MRWVRIVGQAARGTSDALCIRRRAWWVGGGVWSWSSDAARCKGWHLLVRLPEDNEKRVDVVHKLREVVNANAIVEVLALRPRLVCRRGGDCGDGGDGVEGDGGGYVGASAGGTGCTHSGLGGC